MSKPNNVEIRHDLAVQISQLNTECKKIERELKQKKEELQRLFEHRGLDKEQYDDGISACLVKSSYPQLNKAMLANKLGMTIGDLETLMKSCTDILERNPYIKVTP